MKRLFIAIKIQPDEHFIKIYNQLHNNTLNDKIKWVNLNNIHITLKFLGETDENSIETIMSTINKTISNFSKFSFDISKIGIFGSKYSPRIVWAGTTNNKKLIDLATQIIDNMNEIGFLKDRQNFVPHITLGRINYISDIKLFQTLIEKTTKENIQIINVEEIILYESILKKDGPIYNILEKFTLTD